MFDDDFLYTGDAILIKICYNRSGYSGSTETVIFAENNAALAQGNRADVSNYCTGGVAFVSTLT